MEAKWKTLAEIAAEQRIDLAAARQRVEAANCPKIFGTHGTLYLVA